ncbi:MAG: anti-sigma factor [Planctomycetota bacterium]|jgi:anti-sigma factor RsiW
MTNREEDLRAVGRALDGEAEPAESERIREALERDPQLAADEAVLRQVGDRLRQRAGASDDEPVPGLRAAVLDRIRRGDAVIHDLRPFLRRTAAAAAAVLLVAGTAAALRSSALPPVDGTAVDALSHDGIVASLIAPSLGPDGAGR